MDADYKLIIVALLLFSALPAVVLGSKGLKWGLMIWIGTFALGYRTISIAPQVTIHPAEVVLYALCLWLAIQRLSQRTSAPPPWVPLWIWPFALTWILAWWPIVSGTAPAGAMVTEFKNVFLLLPIFILVSAVATDQNSWRPIILTFVCVGLWIGCLGILEYVYPGIKAWWPGFIGNPTYAKEIGFQRAAFSFWGSPDAAYICLLALPFSLYLWEQWRTSIARIVSALAGATLLAAVYVGGHRNTWFLVSLEIAFVLILKKRGYLLAVFAIAFLVVAFQKLPDQARTRVYSGVQLIAGKPMQDDSSGQGRWDRVTASVQRLQDRPWGGGWAAASWVHNDFLQLCESLGLPAGLFLFGVYIYTFYRLLRQVLARSRLGESDWLLNAMFMSHFAAGVIFATDSNIQLTQHIAPIWFIWASAQILLRQLRVKDVSTVDEYNRLRAPAYFQLREAGARHVGIS